MMRKPLAGVRLAVLSMVVLAGCASGPAYQRHDAALPAQWQAATADARERKAQREWWTQFNSGELSTLINAAMDNNHNLLAAASRIAQARAQARVAGASLLPEVSAGADATRARDRGDAAASNEVGVGLNAGFEVDLWGKNRYTHEAALGRIHSSIYARHFVSVTLQAEVAQAYFQVLSAGDRLALARRTLENAESLLRLFEVQYRAGAISALEVERQLSLVSGVRAGIPVIEVERQGALNALAILLGRAPQQFAVQPQPLMALHLPAIAAGLPSELLEQRADIRQAEADLIAAQADIHAARAAFFPSLRLTAAGGIASGTLGALLRGGGLFHSIAAGLTAPIFNHGRLQGEQALTQARQQELVHVYQQAILTALREVEDALTAVQRLAQQHEHQLQLITHAENALRMVELRHRNGAIDFSAVLDAQRVLFAAQAERERIVLSRYAAAVALYRALGGGWPHAREQVSAAPQDFSARERKSK